MSDYLPRHLDAALAEAVRTSPIVVLDGPRGAGKTTSARRLAASTVMLPRDLPALSADPERYLRGLSAPVLIDEWQLAGTELLWILKSMVDEAPAPGRFLLAGSVEPASYGPTYPLTGRAVRLVMRPMSWAELEGRGAAPTFLSGALAGAPLPVSSGRASRFDPGWMVRTGFAAARALPDPRLFLDAYASTVSERAGDEGRDGARLLRTMRILATLTAQTVPDTRIWEAADINKATWRQYDDLLLRTHLSVPSPALESNRLKRLTTYPKRFLADTSMALALSDVAVADLRADSRLAGRYFESFVMQQLRPQVDLARGALMHLRTGAGEREVDAVIEVARKIVGIEVKFGSRPTRADARQLEWLRNEWGDGFQHGYVIHTGGDCYPLGPDITAVPVDHVAQPQLIAD